MFTREPSSVAFLTSTTRDFLKKTESPVDGDHDPATASDGAFDLRREPGRKERAGDRAGVIAERNVKGAVEEWQIVRVRSAHEGREVDEIDARDVPHAGRVERVHGQTRARRDAEDARGLAEEAHPAELGEG
nr:unnamed protein product [Digitaria exilis]